MDKSRQNDYQIKSISDHINFLTENDWLFHSFFTNNNSKILRGGGVVEYNFNVGNMVLILEDFKGIKTGQFSFRAISTIFLNL